MLLLAEREDQYTHWCFLATLVALHYTTMIKLFPGSYIASRLASLFCCPKSFQRKLACLTIVVSATSITSSFVQSQDATSKIHPNTNDSSSNFVQKSHFSHANILLRVKPINQDGSSSDQDFIPNVQFGSHKKYFNHKSTSNRHRL